MMHKFNRSEQDATAKNAKPELVKRNPENDQPAFLILPVI
jgi:hypothetical protein